ncbi:MAG: hypothetical protein K8T10_06270 [Candidatus Eremiobacteraeota bacterium]|nr:hypothetical protein [Candidatus Eremiobacteraeota bacterium]
MKKFGKLLVLFMVFLLFISIAVGCSSRQTTTTPTGEKVTTDKDKKEVVVESEEGTVKIKGDAKEGIVEIEGPEGKVKVVTKGDEGSIKVEGKDGTVVAKKTKDVKESDFPVKFYPKAEVIEGVKAKTNHPSGRKINTNTVKLKSKGKIEDIKDFYVKQIENPVVQSTEEGFVITSLPEESGKGTGTIVTIQKGEKEGEVDIAILSHDLTE